MAEQVVLGLGEKYMIQKGMIMDTKTNDQMTREEVIKMLDKGVTLISLTTKNFYKKVKGKLMRKTKTSNGWEPSDLMFLEPPSWKNMRVH